MVRVGLFWVIAAAALALGVERFLAGGLAAVAQVVRCRSSSCA